MIKSIIVSVYVALASGVGMPFRATLRRAFAIQFAHDSLDIYLVRGPQQLSFGQELLIDALDFIEEHDNLWSKRLKREIVSILCVDMGEPVGYFYADRCLWVNPWKVVSHIPNRADAVAILAGAIIFGVARAILIDGCRGDVGRVFRERLALAAYTRFLARFASPDGNDDISFMIKVLKELKGFERES